MRVSLLKQWIVIMGLFLIGSQASAFSGNEKQAFSGGEGHEVPTPFGITNRRFELSNGELYTLAGRVKWPHFIVDLSRHPFLSSTGKLTKEYLLEGSESQWKDMEYSYVRLTFKAHGKVFYEGNKPHYRISLEYLPEGDIDQQSQ
jgi:hypothetical protein